MWRRQSVLQMNHFVSFFVKQISVNGLEGGLLPSNLQGVFFGRSRRGGCFEKLLVRKTFFKPNRRWANFAPNFGKTVTILEMARRGVCPAYPPKVARGTRMTAMPCTFP